MDRALLAQFLAKAEEHIAKSQERVRRQQQLVADLDRDGHDTVLARQVLAQFEELLSLQLADRDRLAEELSRASR